MTPPPRTWWVPATQAIAIGLVGVGALGQAQLLEGGLAVLAAVWVFAVFLGATLARATWLRGPSPTPEAGIALFATLASAGALAGELPPAWALGVWVAGALLGRFGGVVPWVGILAVGTLACIGVSTALANGTPWEVLAPNPTTWDRWLGTSFGAGALLGWAPWAWLRTEPPHPGRSGLPLAAAGAVLLGALGWSLAQAASWLDHSRPVVLAAVPLLAVASWLTVGPRRHLGLALALAGAATLFFQSEAQRALWWSLTLPLLLGGAAFATAVRTRTALPGLAGAALVVGVGLSYPGLPEDLLTAAAAAIPWVGAVWFVGVRQQVSA